MLIRLEANLIRKRIILSIHGKVCLNCKRQISSKLRGQYWVICGDGSFNDSPNLKKIVSETVISLPFNMPYLRSGDPYKNGISICDECRELFDPLITQNMKKLFTFVEKCLNAHQTKD